MAKLQESLDCNAEKLENAMQTGSFFYLEEFWKNIDLFVGKRVLYFIAVRKLAMEDTIEAHGKSAFSISMDSMEDYTGRISRTTFIIGGFFFDSLRQVRGNLELVCVEK